MSSHDFIPIIRILAAGLIILFVYVRLRYLLVRVGHLLPISSVTADCVSTGATTPAVPASDNNWQWARRIEADERIAQAALRKAEAAAISALEQPDEWRRPQPDHERLRGGHAGTGVAERYGSC